MTLSESEARLTPVRSEESYQKGLAAARAYKRRYKGTCRVCGKETGYHGRGKVVSDICHPCAQKATGLTKRGTGPVNSLVLEYLAEPRRYSEVQAEFGFSQGRTSVTLHRLREQGLIERVSRGVYVRVP